MTHKPDDPISARLMLAFDDLEPPAALFDRIRALFALLMRFVEELKKGAGGWVSPSDLAAAGLIIDVEHRQRYSQLRDRLRPALRYRDGEKFIECNRSKGYRLSTHPSFVTCGPSCPDPPYP